MRSQMFVFYTEDDRGHNTWTTDEDVTWNADGSITLKDGRIARRRTKKKDPIRNHVEHESQALGFNDHDFDPAKQLASDRRIAGENAPDFYSKDKNPVWKEASGLVARKRQRAFCKAAGFTWEE